VLQQATIRMALFSWIDHHFGFASSYLTFAAFLAELSIPPTGSEHQASKLLVQSDFPVNQCAHEGRSSLFLSSAEKARPPIYLEGKNSLLRWLVKHQNPCIESQ